MTLEAAIDELKKGRKTINEVRASLGLPPLPQGDLVYYEPLTSPLVAEDVVNALEGLSLTLKDATEALGGLDQAMKKFSGVIDVPKPDYKNIPYFAAAENYVWTPKDSVWAILTTSLYVPNTGHKEVSNTVPQGAILTPAVCVYENLLQMSEGLPRDLYFAIKGPPAQSPAKILFYRVREGSPGRNLLSCFSVYGDVEDSFEEVNSAPVNDMVGHLVKTGIYQKLSSMEFLRIFGHWPFSIGHNKFTDPEWVMDPSEVEGADWLETGGIPV